MSIDKKNLLERLAQGHAARISVVTPNTRLSRALVAEFDGFQMQKGKTAWEAPDILPFGAFVERLYEDALYSDTAAGLPLLLTPAQEQWLWEEIVSSANLLAIAETAEQCRDAWRLVHQWRIGKGPGNEDTAAFASWSNSYRKRTHGEVDAARLPDLVATLLEEMASKKPEALVAYGFDILPPQTRAFFDACAAHGVEVLQCQPEKKSAAPLKTSFLSAREELEKAAAWARARLENRGQHNRSLSPILRIGVVVPDLQQRRREVQRVFSRVMRPDYQLPGAAKAEMPFNISIGIPLDQYPVVALALSILQFSQKEIPFEEAGRILRSPYIAGAESELILRTQLEVKLRRKLDATVSLPKLIANIDGVPLLRGALEEIFALRETGVQTPSAWARHFSALLEAAGFPGERGLDSEEFQARAKWHEALGELAGLERVSAKISFLQALAALNRICAETLFQPESGDAPIQVLGILESAGIEFDHLWVSGLTDEAWPLAARANPFVPIALQKKAGIPQASAEGSLALDRRITEGWLGAAQEVVFSWHEKDEDREVAASPLIAAIEKKAVEIPQAPRLRDLIFAGKKIQSIEDSQAPAVKTRRVRGGTRVLSDQAACPFRAFAAWRLAAQPLETPAEGLDAAQRGTLIHALMKHLWVFLKDSSSLQTDTAPAIDAAAAAAVKEMQLEGRFAELERDRLARLAAEWLEIEKGRAPFEVVAVEQKRNLIFSNIEYEARIDRMDRLQSGGHALIDYKTSRAPSPKHWEPPRAEDPQLPAYAVSAKEDIAAVAFAKLRPGDMKFMGFSREDKALPNVKKSMEWERMLRGWKAETESLGKAFAAGDARVEPKHALATCRNCALHTVCRIYEKSNPLQDDEA